MKKTLMSIIFGALAMVLMVGGVKAADVEHQFSLNGQYYDSLTNALAAAKDGDTITLLKDRNSSNNSTYNVEKDVTLDLNGKNFVMSSGKLVVKNEKSLTVTNGVYASALEVEAGSTLKTSNVVIGALRTTAQATVANPIKVSGAAGKVTTLEVSADTTIKATTTAIEISNEGVNATINGSIESKWGVYVHGTANAEIPSTVAINATIKGTEKSVNVVSNANVSITGGEYTSTNSNPTVNISNGTLAISGGKITSEANYAVAISGADTKFTISGTAELNSAKDADDNQLPALNITAAEVIDNNIGALTGGRYLGSIVGDVAKTSATGYLANAAVAKLVKEGYIVVEDGAYKVVKAANEEQPADETVAPESQEPTGNTADAKNPNTSDNFMSLVSMVSASAAGLFIAFKKVVLS